MVHVDYNKITWHNEKEDVGDALIMTTECWNFHSLEICHRLENEEGRQSDVVWIVMFETKTGMRSFLIHLFNTFACGH